MTLGQTYNGQLSRIPLHWKVQVEGDIIRFFGDGQLIFEVTDATYRTGYFGFWANGNGTRVDVSNVVIGDQFHTLQK